MLRIYVAMSAEDELSLIYCRVEMALYGNRYLVNEQLAKMLTTKAVERIKSHGYKCVKEPLIPWGGGGGEFWLNLLKDLWEFRDLVGFLYGFKNIIKISFIKHFFRTKKSLKPTFVIHLNIRKTSKEIPNDYYQSLSDKMIGLRILSNDVALFLIENYPLYNFEQQISAYISSKSYMAKVRLSHEDALNNTKLSRLDLLLRKLSERENTSLEISFTNHVFIKRTYDFLEIGEHYWGGGYKSKNFYTIFSSRLISRLPTNKPSIIERYRISSSKRRIDKYFNRTHKI